MRYNTNINSDKESKNSQGQTYMMTYELFWFI